MHILSTIFGGKCKACSERDSRQKSAKQTEELSIKAVAAAYRGDFNGAIELIDQGADVNYVAHEYFREGDFSERWNVGFLAIDKGNMRALEACLDRGLNPNLTGGDGSGDSMSLLNAAIAKKDEKAALLIIARGANIAYPTPDLKTPLEYASLQGLSDVVRSIEAKMNEEQVRRTALVDEDVNVISQGISSSITTKGATLDLKPRS